MFEWPVFPYSKPVEVSSWFWSVSGSIGKSPLTRNMAVVVTPAQRSIIFSAVALHSVDLERFNQQPPLFIVIPNTLHTKDAMYYKHLFPSAALICPQNSYANLSKKFNIEATCEEAFKNHSIKVIQPLGIKPVEAFFEVSQNGQTAALFSDLFFNLPKLSGFGGAILNMIGSTGGFKMTPVGKFFYKPQKDIFDRWMLEYCNSVVLDFIWVAHGELMDTAPNERLRQMFSKTLQ